MKQTLTYILIPLIFAVLVYLATAFIIFSFDLSTLTKSERCYIIVFWFIGSIGILWIEGFLNTCK